MSGRDWFEMLGAIFLVALIVFLLIVIMDTDQQWHDDDRD